MLEQIKKRQYLLLLAIIAVLLVVLLVVSWLWSKSNRERGATPATQLVTGTSRISPQELWVHDFSTKADLTQKRLDVLEEALQKLLKINTTPKEPPVINKEPAAELQQDLAKIFNSPLVNELPPPPGVVVAKTNGAVKPIFKASGLKKINLHLNTKQPAAKLLKTTDNTIAAGSFAAAIILGGVDASTSIQASSDPRPILLRLTDPGTLPRRFKSDLQGCHILAATYGDLSSERVYMRLEKLGCVERKTGEIIELEVQGYVAGEDGRAGVRGALVDKSGATLRNAMVGGFFSSIGKFLGQARTPILFSPTTGLVQNQPLTTEEILKQSAANGLGGALDKYADFYIKRAEQMQPVLQVAAGRKVDVVFTQGFDFADSKVRQTLSKTNDQQRYQQVQKVADTKPVTAWLTSKQGGNSDN